MAKRKRRKRRKSTPRENIRKFAGLVKRARRRKVPKYAKPEAGETILLGNVPSVGARDLGSSLFKSNVMAKIERVPLGSKIRVTLSGTSEEGDRLSASREFDLGWGAVGRKKPLIRSHHLMFHMLALQAATTMDRPTTDYLETFKGDIKWTIEIVGAEYSLDRFGNRHNLKTGRFMSKG